MPLYVSGLALYPCAPAVSTATTMPRAFDCIRIAAPSTLPFFLLSKKTPSHQIRFGFVSVYLKNLENGERMALLEVLRRRKNDCPLPLSRGSSTERPLDDSRVFEDTSILFFVHPRSPRSRFGEIVASQPRDSRLRRVYLLHVESIATFCSRGVNPPGTLVYPQLAMCHRNDLKTRPHPVRLVEIQRD